MVARIPLFLFALFMTALSTPAAMDQDTLLQNARTAQALNTRFQNMSHTDKCNDGESACIDGRSAICTDSAWGLTRCPGNRECFALPSIRRSGTFVGCTSEKNALSIIRGAGGKGGILSTSKSNSIVPLPTLNPTYFTSPKRTVPPGSPSGATTLPTVTTTVSPEEAFSQLMSLLSDGASMVGTSSMSDPTLTPLPSSTSVTIPSSTSPSTVLPSFTSISVPKVSPTSTSSCDDQ